MLQSKLFTKTQKEASGDETSAGTQLLLRAGFIDKVGAGIYTILPLGFQALKNLENIISGEMDQLGARLPARDSHVPHG